MNVILDKDNTEDWKHGKKSNSWVAESLWGHRLKAGQSINILLNEFLCLCEAMHRGGQLLDRTAPNSNPEHTVRRSWELRVILFLNPYLEQISYQKLTDKESWKEWREKMADSHKEAHPSDYSYLEGNFPRFEDFVNRVKLLRRVTIDPGANKRWNYQQLFPIGPDALYVPTEGDKISRDRTLFTRTGEIAYLMISRSDKDLREKIKPHLERLFNENSQKNNLLKKLIQDTNHFLKDPIGTFLPYKKHPAFDRMAEDLLNIFELNLPNQDALEIIKYLVAFNLYIYIIETANHWCKQEKLPPIVCEIISPKMDLVRRVSASNKRENEDLCKKAIENYINQTIKSNADLTELLECTDTQEETKVQALKEAFEAHPFKIKEVPTSDSVADLKKSTITNAKAHCQNGVVAAADALGKICGLSSKRKTNRYRYAPSDELLNALVLANVKNRTEEALVLEKLYTRYGLVIGKVQASKALDEQMFDANQYDKNTERFTQRLIALGLAERLSDACTYVSNHYTPES